MAGLENFCLKEKLTKDGKERLSNKWLSVMYADTYEGRTRGVISRIKYMLEHNAFLRKLVPLCRKMGIVHTLHIWKARRDKRRNAAQRKEFGEFYIAHHREFEKLFSMLDDEESKRTLESVIAFRKTWDIRHLDKVRKENQYFQKDIFEPEQAEVFVDGGAYVGDTIEKLKEVFGGGQNYCKKIYAWEPDKRNIQQMKKTLSSFDNVTIVPCGMWKEKTKLFFSESGGAGSKIVTTGRSTICVDTIDNVCWQEKVSFIKMDIEGSEQDALLGAAGIIRRDRPRLAICIYHKPEDLYEIPFLIKELVPEYRLYIRHHSDTYAETVLYATL